MEEKLKKFDMEKVLTVLYDLIAEQNNVEIVIEEIKRKEEEPVIAID